MDNVIRRYAVGCDRNIIHYRDTKERLNVGVVGLRREWIPEENYHVNLPFRYLCADLLVAAKRARKVSFNRQFRCLADKLCRRTRTAEVVFCKRFLILKRPVYDIRFFIIVRDKRNRFLCFLFHKNSSFVIFVIFLTIIYNNERIVKGFKFIKFDDTVCMKRITTDGNGAVSYVSYAFTEIAAIYPITPSSPMAEQVDEWAACGKKNLFGESVKVVEMQSEGGAAGVVHGALTCGALATTYTCSQGLLLMLPTMYKIAGKLLPTVFHIAARALSTHALSIFGDHQDIAAARGTGFALLISSTPQECADFALISHLATLRGRVPFMHAFDGFRTSHEIQKIEVLDYEEMRPLVDETALLEFRKRALSPNAPMQRGTAQNPDIYFQNRERCNPYYSALPSTVQAEMDKLAALTGRKYHLFDYFGAKNATHVVVMMGSGASAMQETVEMLSAEGESVGLIKIRLYRPFDTEAFCGALPPSVKRITVLDRAKESGGVGEPLYLDICAALKEKGRGQVCVYGGRYGLGGKDFTPKECYAVLQNGLRKSPKNHFTVGIEDDISYTSLPCYEEGKIDNGCVECKFYGLGSDGTVGANKSALQILGDHTDLYLQGYFYYDSKKSGGVTISHLRFGKSPILSSYPVQAPHFVACHNPSYLTRLDMLSNCREGGIFLLNHPAKNIEELSLALPDKVKRQIAQKRLSLYLIDGTGLARKVGLNGRTSVIMQAAFFYLHNELLPYEKAKAYLFEDIERRFAKKGKEIIERNRLAIAQVESALQKIDYPDAWKNLTEDTSSTPCKRDYFEKVILPILHQEGDSLPVSAFSSDGSAPTNTAKLEKPNAPALLPKWIPQNCIQCNQCSFVCPHACIRPALLREEESLPKDFTTINANGVQGKFRIQVSAMDCKGCGVCAQTCPAREKALVMVEATEIAERERKNWAFYQETSTLPPPLPRNSVKGSQFFTPLFEFSYACAGCGETPYIKLLTQLFGERTVIANATGCSSIYGGSAPTCPYAVNEKGQGPAWASSLFENNAEFGLGMRLAKNLTPDGKKESVWIIGGDGWAYDIGYGGLDHIFSTGENVNILVLDSEVYSNTGGQASKSTPLGAVARFAANGKRTKKKELGLMAMSYGNVYVAQVSMGADKNQLIKAFTEAESYEGVSLILAYSPCIAHGVNMSKCMEEEKRAVDSGYWQLYRFNPTIPYPFTLDSKAPTLPLREFLEGENRFLSLQKKNPQTAEELFTKAEEEGEKRFAFYQKLATLFE